MANGNSKAPAVKLTREHVNALCDYIRENATIGVSERSGNPFIGLDGFEHTFGGITATVRLSVYGAKSVEDSAKRRYDRVTADVSKLSAEEKAALLEELTK